MGGCCSATRVVVEPEPEPELASAAALAQAWRGRGRGTRLVAASQRTYGRVVYLRQVGALLEQEGVAEPAALPEDQRLVDSSRKVAFVAGGEFWAASIGLSAREILLRNGVQAAWLESELAAGTRFILVLFDDNERAVWPADWAGVRRAVQSYHPRAAQKMAPHWQALRASSWAELEAEAGTPFAELDEQEGPMTEERYALPDTADTAATARRFLADALNLNPLFAGTGFTVDGRSSGNGSRGGGTPEYLAENRLLSSFPSEQIIDLVA